MSHEQSRGLNPRLRPASAFQGLRLGLGFCQAEPSRAGPAASLPLSMNETSALLYLALFCGSDDETDWQVRQGHGYEVGTGSKEFS